MVNKKVLVNIYCKIYTDNFSEGMANQMATGDEIYDFLMKDAGQCFDESDNVIPGDCNIWYLGCNEKFGHLQLDSTVWAWSFGESSFDIVETFIAALSHRDIITDYQFQALFDKIDEGRSIDDMYDIREYLVCKMNGIEWSKKADAGKTRENMKQMLNVVEAHFTKQGYNFNGS